jgi:hypothetical protein
VDQTRFDSLVRTLSAGVSRKQALKIIGGVVVLAAPLLLPGSAEAASRARRRCRQKGGAYLSQGECRCAVKCGSTDRFSCRGEASCFCGESVEGPGACLATEPVSSLACTASSQCPTDAICVLRRDCPGTGGVCSGSGDCLATDACLNGRCQRTACFDPCPTSP